MHLPMLIPMPASPIRCVHGWVAGGEDGVAAEGVAGVAASAGAGLHLTGTRGGKSIKLNF